MEALDLLDNVVDESDPDIDVPNSYHAYQTAEGIRKAHPDKGESLVTPLPPEGNVQVSSDLGHERNPGGAQVTLSQIQMHPETPTWSPK